MVENEGFRSMEGAECPPVPMCGRFTQHYTWREVHDALDLDGAAVNLRARYNMAPTLLQGSGCPKNLRSAWTSLPGQGQLESGPMAFGHFRIEIDFLALIALIALPARAGEETDDGTFRTRPGF